MLNNFIGHLFLLVFILFFDPIFSDHHLFSPFGLERFHFGRMLIFHRLDVLRVRTYSNVLKLGLYFQKLPLHLDIVFPQVSFLIDVLHQLIREAPVDLANILVILFEGIMVSSQITMLGCFGLVFGRLLLKLLLQGRIPLLVLLLLSSFVELGLPQTLKLY